MKKRLKLGFVKARLRDVGSRVSSDFGDFSLVVFIFVSLLCLTFCTCQPNPIATLQLQMLARQFHLFPLCCFVASNARTTQCD